MHKFLQLNSQDHEFGAHLMPPGRCLSLRAAQEHPRSGEGDDPTPLFPLDGGTRGQTCCEAQNGRERCYHHARGHRRHQMVAGSWHAPHLTASYEARHDSHSRRRSTQAQPPRRDGGRGMASHCIAGAGHLSHSLAPVGEGSEDVSLRLGFD
jgi:hypothetical protein